MSVIEQQAINLTKTLRTPEHVFLCEQLKQTRLAAGLTQTKLAQKLNKPQSYVAKVETLERRLDVVEFVRWMLACDAGSSMQAILARIANEDEAP